MNMISTPQHYCVSYLRQFVAAQYHAAPPQAQSRALQFFHAMDLDGNGIVDYREFRSFFHSEGFQHHTCINLFMILDGNGDHGLDFWEVMTLYYILKTGIGYYICNNCHACRQQQYSRQQRYRPMSNAIIMYPPAAGYTSQQTSNYQIVPWNRNQRLRDKLTSAFRALEFILGVASLVVGIANCSIM